jgi:hypothetical protein
MLLETPARPPAGGEYLGSPSERRRIYATGYMDMSPFLSKEEERRRSLRVGSVRKVGDTR